MRRSRERARQATKRKRPGEPTTPPATVMGTIKSLETDRGTGSIAPDMDADVTADTGFERAVVAEDGYADLRVTDRVRFEATPDAGRPGHATASRVEPDRER